MSTMTNLTDDAHSTGNEITDAEAKEIDDAYKEVCSPLQHFLTHIHPNSPPRVNMEGEWVGGLKDVD